MPILQLWMLLRKLSVLLHQVTASNLILIAAAMVHMHMLAKSWSRR